jgi:hypothetical protein
LLTKTIFTFNNINESFNRVSLNLLNQISDGNVKNSNLRGQLEKIKSYNISKYNEVNDYLKKLITKIKEI